MDSTTNIIYQAVLDTLTQLRSQQNSYSLTSIIPSIITIFLFVAAYFVNQKREKAKEIVELMEQEEYLYIVGESIIENSKSLLTNSITFRNSLTEKDFKHFGLRSEPKLILENYETVSLANRIKIFVDLKKGGREFLLDLFKRHNDAFLLIKASQKAVIEDFLSFSQSYEDLSDKWNTSLKSFTNLNDRFVNLAVEKGLGNDKSLALYSNTIKEFADSKNTTIHHTKETLLTPLREYWKELPGDFRTPQILALVNEADTYASLTLSELKFYGTVFDDINNKFETAIKSFESTLLEIKKLDAKSLTFLVKTFIELNHSVSDD